MARKTVKTRKNNVLTFTILIMVLFASIVLIEIITMNYENYATNEIINKNAENYKKNQMKYDTSDIVFSNVLLGEELSELKSTCDNGCSFEIGDFDLKYQYIIKKKNHEYFLDIVYNNEALIKDKSLGNDIENLYIMNYSGFASLFNKVTKDNYTYDYVIALDKKKNTDEITTVNENEMRFTTDGIVYTYDKCETKENTNGVLVTAKKFPFQDEAEVISLDDVNFDWCNEKQE